MHAGLLELLTAVLAAVLNLSTLVANQPKIARRGLLVLLKTNSSLFEVVSTRVSVYEHARLPSSRLLNSQDLRAYLAMLAWPCPLCS